MKDADLLECLKTVGQGARLQILRTLVGSGPMTPERIGQAIGEPAHRVGYHLNQLARTGLVTARQEGSDVVYTAETEEIRGFTMFLAHTLAGNIAPTSG